MKNLFRNIFSPLLNKFEAGDGAYAYKKSHRVILNIVGCLFMFLAVCIFTAGVSFAQIGAAFPGLIFLAVSITCLVVGTLGNDRAVAKIWGSLR